MKTKMSTEEWTITLGPDQEWTVGDVPELDLRNADGDFVLSAPVSWTGARSLSKHAFEHGALSVRFDYDLARTEL